MASGMQSEQDGAVVDAEVEDSPGD